MGLQMSFAQTFNVFQAINLTAGQKMVLAGISTFTDSTGKAWPSVATIAARCSMGVRTVQRHIAKLVSLGYLDRIYRTGRAAVTRVKLSGTTPAKLAPTPLPNWQTESAIESVNEITAQAAAPALAENPAVAAVVVFDSVDTEVRGPAPVVDLVANLPDQHEVQSHDGIAPNTFIKSSHDAMTSTLMDKASHDVTHTPPADLVVSCDKVPAEGVARCDTLNPLADVPTALLDDFGIVRKAKKKPAAVTRTEAVVFASEAAKAGMTVAQAVEHCIHRGWSRFDAQWVPAAPAMTLQRVYVPEVAPPANPDIVRAELAKLAAQPGPTAKMADPLAWAKSTLARHQAGEHVSGFALRSARAALRL